ncbi:MAG TPA: hypothetical protein VF170_00735 [Planctomycetaceae bacterium]
MTDTQNLGLTKDQLDLVLRGLRFVRSAISMELLDPSDETAARRSRQLREVDSLVRQLGGKAERVAAGV